MHLQGFCLDNSVLCTAQPRGVVEPVPSMRWRVLFSCQQPTGPPESPDARCPLHNPAPDRPPGSESSSQGRGPSALGTRHPYHSPPVHPAPGEEGPSVPQAFKPVRAPSPQQAALLGNQAVASMRGDSMRCGHRHLIWETSMGGGAEGYGMHRENHLQTPFRSPPFEKPPGERVAVRAQQWVGV